MNGSNRVSKGKKYELQISKDMSKAFKTNVSRTPMSGSWRGSNNDYNNHEDNRFLGDLFFPLNHPMNIFNIELKNHADIKLRSFFINSSRVQEFMNQVVTDAHRKDGYSVPILICKVSREDNYLVIPYQDDFYNNLIKNEYPAQRLMLTNKDKMNKSINRYDCILTNLKSFMKFSVKDLTTWYKDVDWDKLNTNIKIEDDSEDEIVSALSAISHIKKDTD